MRVTMLLSSALLLASPGALTAQAAAAPKAEIAASNQAWQAGWNAGDAGKIASLYAEDAVVMAPGGEPIEGREAIRAAFAEVIAAAGGSQMKLESRDLMHTGDMAVEVGSFVETAADGSHRDHGSYVTVLKRVDGDWTIVRDIWNSSMRP